MTFDSETDTEVIPKLCMYVYNNLTEPLAFSEVRIMLRPTRAYSQYKVVVDILICFPAFQKCIVARRTSIKPRHGKC